MKIDKGYFKSIFPGLRQLAYLLICTGTMLFQHVVALHAHERIFAENAVVENLQFALLLAAFMVFLALGIIKTQERVLCFCLASLCVLGAFREMDNLLDVALPVLSWRIGFVFVVAAMIFAALRWREVLYLLPKFMASRSFVMLCIAFMVVLVLAQLLGHKPFLRAVLTDIEHVGTIKECFEESVETVGYMLIFLASIEACFELNSSDNLR